jgi:vacuolar-type H+-ATPase subunit F/Vma7
MGRLVVIGEGTRVSGFLLAGADVIPAESPAEVESAWSGLGPDVAVVIVTPAAADVVHALRRTGTTGADRLVAVMPS